MRELARYEPSDAGAWEEAAKSLVHRRKVGVIALTMGHLGAVLVTREQVLRAPPLAISPVGAVGAGDSFLGALVFGLTSGSDLANSFRQAAAAGAAALLNRAPGFACPATSNVSLTKWSSKRRRDGPDWNG